MRVVVVRTIEIFETDENNLAARFDRNFSHSHEADYWLYAHITIGITLFLNW